MRPRSEHVALALCGFTTATILSGRTAGEPGIMPSVIVGNFHLHHWILASIATAVLFRKHPNISAYLLGVSIQGLTYADAFKFMRE